MARDSSTGSTFPRSIQRAVNTSRTMRGAGGEVFLMAQVLTREPMETNILEPLRTDLSTGKARSNMRMGIFTGASSPMAFLKALVSTFGKIPAHTGEISNKATGQDMVFGRQVNIDFRTIKATTVLTRRQAMGCTPGIMAGPIKGSLIMTTATVLGNFLMLMGSSHTLETGSTGIKLAKDSPLPIPSNSRNNSITLRHISPQARSQNLVI